jgi:taurine dioxygenase
MDVLEGQVSVDGITVKPLDAALGARVICGPLAHIKAEQRAAVHKAYLDNLILVFPNQSMTDEEQLTVTQLFGEIADVGLAQGRMQISTVTNVGDKPLLGNADLRWHSDQSFEDIPISASLLRAVEVPPSGGDTYWNNMYLAYQTLTPSLRERIKGRTIKNDASTNSAGMRVMRVPETTDVRTSQGPSHPIIRTHPETGLDALYLGRRPFAYVNGLSLEESEELLDALWEHASNPAFEYRHHWTPGDLIVWDNRAVMHRRDAFDNSQVRVMKRTQCLGTRPSYDPAAEARGAHPRGKDWA